MNLIPIMVNMTVAETQQQFNMTVEESIASTPTPPYEGDYIVVPSVNEQVLLTNGLRMTDNVTVTEIPYFEVSNQSGVTVFIADNINND